MTIDDESSIYVGGLPYDATEDSLRRVFEIYGAVVAVKIINDRAVGGKCYGFVTFTNPRSAMHAINEMDGRTIDGRVVRVNEVRTRGGRSNFGRESSRHNTDRDMDVDQDRDRERDYEHERDRDLDGGRDRSRERDEYREREYGRVREQDRPRDHFADRGESRGRRRDFEDADQEYGRDHDRIRERDRDAEIEMQMTKSRRRGEDDTRNQLPKFLNGSDGDMRGNGELSAESSDADEDQVENKLQKSKNKLEQLRKEIAGMEELAEEKKQWVATLQKNSQKLEDSLTSAKKLTLHRQMQLANLHKYYTQVRDCRERLKHSEQELQSLVDTTNVEFSNGSKDGLLTNGIV